MIKNDITIEFLQTVFNIKFLWNQIENPFFIEVNVQQSIVKKNYDKIQICHGVLLTRASRRRDITFLAVTKYVSITENGCYYDFGISNLLEWRKKHISWKGYIFLRKSCFFLDNWRCGEWDPPLSNLCIFLESHYVYIVSVPMYLLPSVRSNWRTAKPSKHFQNGGTFEQLDHFIRNNHFFFIFYDSTLNFRLTLCKIQLT